MWFGRTITCCLGGWHNVALDRSYEQREYRIKGVTEKVDKTEYYKNFENWEAGNQEVLQKLVTLL
jgi:hypothetical protein